MANFGAKRVILLRGQAEGCLWICLSAHVAQEDTGCFGVSGKRLILVIRSYFKGQHFVWSSCFSVHMPETCFFALLTGKFSAAFSTRTAPLADSDPCPHLCFLSFSLVKQFGVSFYQGWFWGSQAESGGLLFQLCGKAWDRAAIKVVFKRGGHKH